MSLEHIRTKQPILTAVSEWERRGNAAFRKRYPSGGAKRFFLIVAGKRYDLKLIMTAAHRIAYPDEPFLSVDFHTYKAVGVAERLGFKVFVLPKDPTEEISKVATKEKFDPNSPSEGRKKILAAIVQRQGQPQFRKRVLSAYGSKCALSGCSVAEALDAAHISPYDGPSTNHVTNGMLLRADLHTLYDIHFMAIDAKTLRVSVDPSLRGTEYWRFNGKRIRIPQIPSYGRVKKPSMHIFKALSNLRWCRRATSTVRMQILALARCTPKR